MSTTEIITRTSVIQRDALESFALDLHCLKKR